jgi:hypothetical protein
MQIERVYIQRKPFVLIYHALDNKGSTNNLQLFSIIILSI